MACPAKTKTQGNTTYTNKIMMELQFHAPVALTLATGCTSNSSIYCIRCESLYVKQQDKQKIHFNNETTKKGSENFPPSWLLYAKNFIPQDATLKH
jgi:hypothetical protein